MKFIIILLLLTFIQCVNCNNIVFIISDDMNADFIENTAIMPHYNRILRSEGVTSFPNTYSTACICNPSRTSILTGKYPSVTGVITNENHIGHPEELNFIMETFRANNITTISAGKVLHTQFNDYLSSTRNLWDYFYDQPTPIINKSDNICPTNQYLFDLGYYCQKYPDVEEDNLPLNNMYKFLTNINLTDNFFMGYGIRLPHVPFLVPNKYWKFQQSYNKINTVEELKNVSHEAISVFNLNNSFYRMINDNDCLRKIYLQGYTASVAYADEYIGRLWDYVMNHYKNNTMVIITSDQGYHLGSKAIFNKMTHYLPTVRVPLLIYVPNTERKVIESPTSLIDLYDTMLDWMNITHNGKSLLPLLKSDTTNHRRFAFTQCKNRRQLTKSVHSDRFSLITYKYNGKQYRDLYDIKKDKYEKMTLFLPKTIEYLEKMIEKEFGA